MSEEIWRDISGYEGLYQVSNFGRVRRLYKTKLAHILKPLSSNNGYLRVHLSRENNAKMYTIHRLVAEAFVPNLDGKPQVNHIDGDKTNNNVSNLEWVTDSENKQHAFDTGLRIAPIGEKHHLSKLTNEQAQYIRENPDNLTLANLAEIFSVMPLVISKIQRGQSYVDAGGSIRDKINTRIPNEIREQIRREYVKGSREFGSRALAKKYGYNSSTILNIVHGK